MNYKLGFYVEAPIRISKNMLLNLKRRLLKLLHRQFKSHFISIATQEEIILKPAQNSKLIDFTIEKSEQSGVGIYHETHRSRMCFAAHITKTFLEKHPKMKVTLDISHWTNVHESLVRRSA